MQRPLLHALLTGAIVFTTSATSAQTSASPKPATTAATSSPDAETQAWLQRRQHFLDVIKRLQTNDALARREFERLVRGFEQQPFALTPLEATDYIGAVFVPQAGVEKMLPLVAAQAALGLYDMWRFGSPLAEAELLEGERFLRRPLALGGQEQVDKARAFMRDNATRTAQLIQEGLQLAEGERLSPGYNSRWVRALGRCEAEAAATCPQPRNVPVAEWEALWQKARERVMAYYRVDPPAPTESAASAPR